MGEGNGWASARWDHGNGALEWVWIASYVTASILGCIYPGQTPTTTIHLADSRLTRDETTSGYNVTPHQTLNSLNDNCSSRCHICFGRPSLLIIYVIPPLAWVDFRLHCSINLPAELEIFSYRLLTPAKSSTSTMSGQSWTIKTTLYMQ